MFCINDNRAKKLTMWLLQELPVHSTMTVGIVAILIFV